MLNKYLMILSIILLPYTSSFNTQIVQLPFAGLSRIEQANIIKLKVEELKPQNQDFTHITINNKDIMPLLWAADTGYLLKWLLKQGADPDIYYPDTGMTPLTQLMKKGYWVATTLAEYANVNLPSRSGNTPLMYGIETYANETTWGGKIDLKNIMEILLKHGANPYMQNHQGKDAFDIAKEKIKNKTELNDILNLFKQQYAYFRDLTLTLQKKGLPRELIHEMVKSGYVTGPVESKSKI